MITKTADITFAINIFLVNFWLKKSITNLAKYAIKFMKFAAFSSKSRDSVSATLFTYGRSNGCFIDLQENIIPDNTTHIYTKSLKISLRNFWSKKAITNLA